MNFCDYLDPERIFLRLPGVDRTEFLDGLLSRFLASSAVLSQPDEVRGRLRDAVLEREGYSSTALGNAIWFPHARVPALNGVLVALATSANPLPGPTPDNVPIRVACLVIVPRDQPILALKMVASIVRALTRPDARDAFADADTPAAVYERLRKLAPDLEPGVRARDLMRPLPWAATPETPLAEICRKLLEYRLPAVAVCDASGRFLGGVEAGGLLRYGLPDFFMKLKSVAFVRDFDPCERYFARESQSTAGETLDTDAATVPEDATLLEVVHQLAVKRHSIVYVLRDGAPAGMIDQASILNRVLAP